jgi:mannosyltransferase OCH1-like enzyme
MTVKHRLDAALGNADRLRDAGDFDGARAALEAVVADSTLATLPPVTALGLNRRLHAALLRLAKRSGDRVARAGLQMLMIPPPEALSALTAVTTADRLAIAQANAKAVPRLIHQVWIGDLPVPPACAAWRAHAEEQGYSYRLWREADLATLGSDGDAVFRTRLAAGDYPGAVDAARYAILAREGGIYLDCDWYPARSDIGFHHLLPMTGLTAMAEDIPRLTGKGPFLLANSFIAAPAGHPVLVRLRALLPQAAEVIPGAPAWWTTGPLVFTLLARGGSLTLADAALVATTLPRAAPFTEVERAVAQARDGGLLIGWKSW